MRHSLRNAFAGSIDRLELALFTIHHRILNEAAAATTAGAVPQPPAGVAQ
jgi:hypothetical protein